MHRFNRGVMAACICFVVATNLYCGREGNGLATESSTLTLHVPDGDEHSLGPADMYWFLVFLGLAVDPTGTEDFQPRLLDRWEHTPDYTEWTVHVRDDVWWDDGVPVTAEDVKFSLELWTHPAVLYQYPHFEKITILDSHTLQITFKEPVSGTIFGYNWLAMVPKHLLNGLDVEQLFSWPFWVTPVGNGPFRYVRHATGIMTELEANPDYYGKTPNILKVVLRYGGNSVTELISENVDIVTDISPLEAVRLAEDPRFQIYHRVQWHRAVAIAWNHRNPLFNDADVRRALTMSIDRRELHRILDYPDDTPIFDVPVKRRHHVQGIVPDPLPFAPERAARLLAEAGWVDTDGDDIRERDGQEFRFTLMTSAETETQAVYIQNQLRRVGVRMEISTQNRSVLLQRLNQHDFDAAIQNYNFINAKFGESDVTGYANPEVSRLRDAAWFTIDPGEADEHMQELWKVFGEEIPITYLHPTLSYLAANRRVGGLQNDGAGMFTRAELFSMVEHLWIEDN